MFTLTIEHAITDYPTWRSAFDRFADARGHAGVLTHRIRRPIGDDRYLVIELDFQSQDNAEAFKEFLTNVVWPEAPALVGTPTARVLEPVSETPSESTKKGSPR